MAISKVRITVEPGVTVKTTRRATNRSASVLLTVNKDTALEVLRYEDAPPAPPAPVPAPPPAPVPPTPPAPAPVPPSPPPSGSYDVSARLAAFASRLSQERPGPWPLPVLPAAPTITTRRTVSNASEMQAAMGVTGVEVTFAGPGFEGTLRPRADQRWIFPAGFTLTGPGGGQAIGVDQTQRVELVGTGGRVVGSFVARQVTDLRVAGMDIRAGTAQYYNLNSVDQCQRVEITGSFLFAPGYGLIYADNTDFVLANSEVHASGIAATTRGARNQRVILLDSRVVNAGSQQQVRQHAGTPAFGVFNLQIEGGTGAYFGAAGDPVPSVHDLVMLDNSYYGSGDFIFTDGQVAGGVVVGNRGYTSWGGGSQISVNLSGIVRDNLRLAPQTPPVWTRR
jgi:hypothetical protein